MIQNPGKKSRAAIVLQGRQGIGKNRFTDVIAELTSRYSCSNITNIDEFTGRFNSVVENKMFAVLNEMMNYNDSKKGVATVMKSIISVLTIRINEKNQPRRTAENVMNIIYVTNADMPVQLDTDVRRHLVCACKTIDQVSEEHKEDVDYFNVLSQSYTQEFYENLMTFLLERDISQFNPTLIPMTEAKKQLNFERLFLDQFQGQFVSQYEDRHHVLDRLAKIQDDFLDIDEKWDDNSIFMLEKAVSDIISYLLMSNQYSKKKYYDPPE
ncbi:MAG: hypothetical protein EZS28_029640 [Streblomastix strix]|uniref:NrS-1 polymerase-like helicase domain-containing protein n=1 Tax=Streblomastix strix TaxID=222440 RepID=A0A5J4UX46_9EUKA|nr:MAG: hypothetical protein EZS28_029640 [Streblomastix strix]